ncbi:MAG: DNA polymerase III subunit gamma/tau [Bacteroidales bacterium]|nr:DNA polymerase III subunit gamma/tau [Bacteroidales bacterium]
MSEYIVSARKYRPDSFEGLIGQDTIARTLKNSILRGQLAHAYLFCGPRGVGKTSTARIFAKTINCANPTPDMEPCGHCESCESFQEGRSYCIHELDAASNNGVEDIKALMDQVQIPPQVGKYSVYIIDEVHMLSTSAFNAFLKTLEEPPAHAIFILATTEKHKVLPTILSRCQTYDFNRISVSDMVKNLKVIAKKEGVKIDEESLHVIGQKADGSMRDALTIFDQTVAFCGTDVKYEDVLRNLNVLDYEYSFSLVEDFLKGDYASAMKTFDGVLAKGFNALHFVGALSSHLRDLLVAGSGGMDALLDLPASLKERYREQASRCSLPFLYNALAITTQCEAGYRASLNPRLHIEFALMRLCFLTDPDAVAVKPAAAPVPVASKPPVPAAAPAVPEKPSEPAPVPSRTESGSARAEHFGEASNPARQGNPDQAAEKPATEKPVVEKPEPEAKPARGRKKKTGASLSLNAIIGEQEEKEMIVGEGDATGGDLPSDEILETKWKDLPGKYPDKQRLFNTLMNARLEITEDAGKKLVAFNVTNEAQKRWIEEKILRELETSYQKLVGSPLIRLAVRVVPEEEKAKELYTAQEKAKFLVENESDVKNLVSDLGLDTK